MSDTEALLRRFVEDGCDAAFREIVSRFIDLVYSTAVRLLEGDTHRAEDVTQIVFADLARKAKELPPHVLLGGWLHRHTCFVARNHLRGERRRLHREREAMESSEDHSAANLAQIAPVLDEAINELEAEDRAAILLRFFEQQDFRSVGTSLGSNEEAARKRVGRALEKLHALLTRRGVALSVGAVAGVLSTHAVSAAPVGLAAAAANAALAGNIVSAASTVQLVHTITMTKLQAGIISAVVLAAASVPLAWQHQQNVRLRSDNAALRQEVAQLADLKTENERLNGLLAAQAVKPDPDAQFRELQKLRGEVGVLRQQTAAVHVAQAAAATNTPFSGILKDLEMRKMLREQQKTGMGMLFGNFARELNLSAEQKEKFNDLLADYLMGNVEHLQTILLEKKSLAEADQLFAAAEQAMRAKLGDIIGADNLPAYADYNRDLMGRMSAEQFKAEMNGDAAAKKEKAARLAALLREETHAALAAGGYPADYQTLPILNFRNIAFPSEGDKSLALLETIYGRTTARAGDILAADELERFSQFTVKAVQQQRMALVMNQKMMTPPGH